MVVDDKTSNDKTLLNRLFSYSSSQENIKYIIFVIISGFSAGFFAWSIPLDEKNARIGIGCKNGNPKENFDLFLKSQKIKIFRFFSFS